MPRVSSLHFRSRKGKQPAPSDGEWSENYGTLYRERSVEGGETIFDFTSAMEVAEDGANERLRHTIDAEVSQLRPDWTWDSRKGRYQRTQQSEDGVVETDGEEPGFLSKPLHQSCVSNSAFAVGDCDASGVSLSQAVTAGEGPLVGDQHLYEETPDLSAAGSFALLRSSGLESFHDQANGYDNASPRDSFHLSDFDFDAFANSEVDYDHHSYSAYSGGLPGKDRAVEPNITARLGIDDETTFDSYQGDDEDDGNYHPYPLDRFPELLRGRNKKPARNTKSSESRTKDRYVDERHEKGYRDAAKEMDILEKDFDNRDAGRKTNIGRAQRVKHSEDPKSSDLGSRSDITKERATTEFSQALKRVRSESSTRNASRITEKIDNLEQPRHETHSEDSDSRGQDVESIKSGQDNDDPISKYNRRMGVLQRVQPDPHTRQRNEKEEATATRLFFEPIGGHVNGTDILAAFTHCEGFVDAQIGELNHEWTWYGSSWGFVDFSSPQACLDAYEAKKGLRIAGCPVSLAYASSMPSSHVRQAENQSGRREKQTENSATFDTDVVSTNSEDLKVSQTPSSLMVTIDIPKHLRSQFRYMMKVTPQPRSRALGAGRMEKRPATKLNSTQPTSSTTLSLPQFDTAANPPSPFGIHRNQLDRQMLRHLMNRYSGDELASLMAGKKNFGRSSSNETQRGSNGLQANETSSRIDNGTWKIEMVEEEPYTVKCICNFTDGDENTIYCSRCDTWQHVECFYPSKWNRDEAIPEDFSHSCDDCEPRLLDRNNAIQRMLRLNHTPRGQIGMIFSFFRSRRNPARPRATKKWSLIMSKQPPEPYSAEKFFLYYHDFRRQWARVTVTVDYARASGNNLEKRLAKEASVLARFDILMDTLRRSLLRIKFCSTITSIRVTSEDDRVQVLVSDAIEWISSYPFPLARSIKTTLFVPKVPESSIKFEAQLSPLEYRVKLQSATLVRHDMFLANETKNVIDDLLQLSSSSHIARLKGIIVNDTSTFVTGILLSPLGSSLLSELKRPVEWKRRLKWARQIAECAKDVTALGFIIVDWSLEDIFLDGEDNAKVRITFKNHIVYRKRTHEEAATEKLALKTSYANVRGLHSLLQGIEKGIVEVPAWFADLTQRWGPHDFAHSTTDVDECLRRIVNALDSCGVDDAELSGGSEVEAGDINFCDDDLFDTNSVMSIETAISSMSAHSNLGQNAIAAFVDLLFEKVDIHGMAKFRAEAKIPDNDRVSRGIRRHLKRLSVDLGADAPEIMKRDINGFFQSASRLISMAITHRTGLNAGAETTQSLEKGVPEPIMPLDIDELPPIWKQPREEPAPEPAPEPRVTVEMSDAESEYSEAEIESQEPTIDLDSMRQIVSASDGFKTFIAELEELICPRFDIRLKRMSKVAKENRDEVDPTGVLRETLSELLYARPLELYLSEVGKYSWVDRAKDYVETSFSQPWDWWPLRPKKPALSGNQAILTWECRCGENRTAYLRKDHARYIMKARKETTNGFTSSGNVNHARDVNIGSSQSTSQDCRPADNTQSNSSGGMRNSPYVPSPSSTLVGSSTAISSDETPLSRYIPLLVPSGALLLNEIESQSLCNDGLFDRIRDTYHMAKGMKRWFSTMKFSHCEFFKFEEWSKKRYCERSPGIPPFEDSEYYYAPRPMDREPPISCHEFHDRFYRKVTGEDCHSGVPREMCSDTDAVERIPQINKLVSISEKKRQQFYGIVMREKQSGLMMMVYILLCSIPGFIFFFLWIFHFGHDSLQDASTPLMLTWALPALLYAAQFL